MTKTPKFAKIAGQDHMLAYINQAEADMLKKSGGAGVPVGPAKIPAYPPKQLYEAQRSRLAEIRARNERQRKARASAALAAAKADEDNKTAAAASKLADIKANGGSPGAFSDGGMVEAFFDAIGFDIDGDGDGNNQGTRFSSTGTGVGTGVDNPNYDAAEDPNKDIPNLATATEAEKAASAALAAQNAAIYGKMNDPLAAAGVTLGGKQTAATPANVGNTPILQYTGSKGNTAGGTYSLATGSGQGKNGSGTYTNKDGDQVPIGLFGTGGLDGTEKASVSTNADGTLFVPYNGADPHSIDRNTNFVGDTNPFLANGAVNENYNMSKDLAENGEYSVSDALLGLQNTMTINPGGAGNGFDVTGYQGPNGETTYYDGVEVKNKTLRGDSAFTTGFEANGPAIVNALAKKTGVETKDFGGSVLGDGDGGYVTVDGDVVDGDFVKGAVIANDDILPGGLITTVFDPDLTCPEGYEKVNGTCVKISTNACPTGFTLVNGVCVPDDDVEPPIPKVCPPGFELRNGTCVRIGPGPVDPPDDPPIDPPIDNSDLLAARAARDAAYSAQQGNISSAFGFANDGYYNGLRDAYMTDSDGPFKTAYDDAQRGLMDVFKSAGLLTQAGVNESTGALTGAMGTEEGKLGGLADEYRSANKGYVDGGIGSVNSGLDVLKFFSDDVDTVNSQTSNINAYDVTGLSSPYKTPTNQGIADFFTDFAKRKYDPSYNVDPTATTSSKARRITAANSAQPSSMLGIKSPYSGSSVRVIN